MKKPPLNDAKKLFYFLIFFLVELLAFFKPLLAAEPYTNAQNPPIPNPIPPAERESTPLPIPPLLPPPEQLLQPPTTPPAPAESLLENIPGKIKIQQFNFEGNTVFSDEHLREILSSYIDKEVTFSELLQARSLITKYYIDKGYITTGALIPPQTLERGIVLIQIIEGQLENIKITGTNRLDPNYIRSRIETVTQNALNTYTLLEALQNLQLNPLIATISAELTGGTKPGSSILEVIITEAPTFQTQILLDNSRSPSIGSFRRQISASELNLLGIGDSLGLTYANTDGSNNFDIRYSLPVNPRNGILTLSYNRSTSLIIQPPFDQLDIKGKSHNYEINFRQPIIEKPTQEFALGFSAIRRENYTTLLGEPFPLSAGANEQGETQLNILRFYQDWTTRDSQQVFVARSQFSLGLGWGGTRNQEPPDSRFFAWRGQSQWLRQIAPDTLVVIRGDIQLASRSLLPLEQFTIGGLENVRGYAQDTILSDNGVFASAEVRVPVYRLSEDQGALFITPFIDFGTGWNSSEITPPGGNTLLSVGLGLRFQLGENLTANLDYGIPLINSRRDDRTWQDNGLYFSIFASPF
ncbi:ShlB/FhaC/HecB family hemolysin secretion/activation protein [Ancylothrix sp. C2]|uniref:ShlB/FhaC/HecB family hemolysin secretion/activation protein n=1 Tax=Ancylothrix sp. D3o TaxID=2953691 RepID=UPI0021BB521D|nr:ShlB/FhaC/HecB family hemolysin secretion/activation protein [Ancylothrix sp. D3o]MCT7950252.1 ShlB/FhaC/HecB family hemolysin secretion/activation protein [Ancylothrix sp. D3o]